jgi:L-alanine-DL-glutamate epimerase-like enolase superfamily enzyme
LRITSVTTAVIAGNFPWVLVRIGTDTGVTGLGEAYWGAGVAELVHKAKPLLIGQDPTNIGRLFDIMVRCLSGEGSQAGATVTAISGIEIALWDLLPCRRNAGSGRLRAQGQGGRGRRLHRHQVRPRHAEPLYARRDR